MRASLGVFASTKRPVVLKGSSGNDGVLQVVATKFFADFRVNAACVAAASLLIGASPAMANASASSADIGATLRTAQENGASGTEDEKFTDLFNTWQDYEERGLVAVQKAKPSGTRSMGSGVAIPSLTPIDYVRVSSQFGLREHPVLGGRRAHAGMDLAAPSGTPIRATADGVVHAARWNGGYGLFVEIEHGGDIDTRYGHMSRLNVAEGQVVRKGDVIGYVGSTGRSTGPHLHYEVRIDGAAVDPAPYMQGGQIAMAVTEGGRGGE